MNSTRLNPRPREPVRDWARSTVHAVDGRAVPLRPQPARVLAYLLEREGSLVTRAELVRHAWGDGLTVAFDDGLNFCVRQVREALGESASEARFLQTLPRRGYRFVGPVSRAPLTARRAGAPAPSRWSLYTRPVAIVLLVVIAFTGPVDQRGEESPGRRVYAPLSSLVRDADVLVHFTLDAVEAHLAGRDCAWRPIFHPPA